ncbi:MAG: Eco57I restriction-modification methylase domain-containing protein [Ktedonobacteraceae bacterium]
MQAVYKSYYTKSDALVNYMVDMLSLKPGMRIFEPCAGDGVFIDAITKKTSDTCIDAIELNPDAFSFLKKKYAQSKDIQIRNCDTLFDEELLLYAGMGGIYDRIIANPPYGGWQDFDRRKDLKKLFPGLYVKETYALFLYRCIQLLADKGKLVFIIPETF